ncbi:type III secretion system cytoplasmic ring protein SctQ [Pseudomonas sp. D4-18]|uniref:type III secretion system cytoplasmic ring protein SctQ n=1 Tax=Pseudomonas sp. R1-18 TaxID=1632772 RepID=UPI003DA9FBDE
MNCELRGAPLMPTQSLPCAPLRDLPQFAVADVPLHNRLHRRMMPWRGQLGGQPFSISLAAGLNGSPTKNDVIGLALGDIPLELHAPRALLEQSACAGLVGTGNHGYRLRTETDAMLLELAWLSWIEPLEALLGASLAGEGLRVVPVTPLRTDAPPRMVPLAIDIRIGEAAPLAASLHMSESGAARIAALLEHHARSAPDPLETLRLPLAVQAADAPLTLGELRSLQPGDVVMLDCLPEHQLLLRLGDSLQTRARRAGDKLECLTPLIAVNPDRNDVMTQTATASDLDVSLDDLPIKLVCQIGSVELSLAQVREMGPGSLLQLGSTAHDGVDLMVNGRRVGRGELVTIGDGLGVRLLEFCAQ